LSFSHHKKPESCEYGRFLTGCNAIGMNRSGIRRQLTGAPASAAALDGQGREQQGCNAILFP
jgi:hypothetical protein